MNVLRRLGRGRIQLAVILPALFLLLAVLPPAERGHSQAGQKPAAGAAAKLEIKHGDHICIIGNTLADRMQHDGWLEAYLYQRFPKHDLVFRNLGFSGDELTIKLRSLDFGSPDQWLSGSAPIPQPKKLKKDAPVKENRLELTNTKADVIFAFFGYNESFAGAAGLPKFKKDLENFIKHTLAQQYNGKSAPRLVLFSPIAHENLNDPNLPDGTENNKRLEMYTEAMSEVAAANKVPFVDIFHPTMNFYADATVPLTINGVHLNAAGNRKVAAKIDKILFGDRPDDPEKLEKIRKAVADKNFFWYNRYRTVDGYSVFSGDRAFLKFTNGQSNYEVAQREMEILDIMVANRDKACWAAAQGKEYKVDDSNIPANIPVITNLPGKLPGGKHLFLPGDEAIKKMTIAKNMKINLFASEKEFPELVNPVAMQWDTKGRLWVACWHTYPHWNPTKKMDDKLIILEDTDGDGKADKMTVFADNLHCPTGFAFYNGGVLVAQAPGIVFMKDIDGDDKADIEVRVLDGLDSADTHHTANSFVVDPGGAVYFQEGTFHHTQVETPWGPPVRRINAGVYRYEPRAQKFEVYVAFGFANPHGHVFDKWGQDFVVDGTGAEPFHGTLFSGQVDFPHGHPRPPKLYNPKTRPCPGMEILSSRHFPDEMQGNLLVANVITFHGILQYKFKDKGASFQGLEIEPIVSSTDPNFRPADIKVGPDGAIYFSDWHNPIIGHMQHNLRDPNRSTDYGRVYRVTYEGRALLKPKKIYGKPVEKLLDLLKEPEDSVRSWTRTELSGRPTSEVIPAVQKWLANLDKNDANYEYHMLEGLWLHQSHNVINESLLKRILRSPDFHARAAATKVLCYWRDRVKDPIQLLQVQLNDSHPRVRLEAIRALSFFNTEEALNVSLEMLAHPEDEYLRFVFNETLNTLERRLGAKVDRKNIAASVLQMLDKGKIPADRQPLMIETVIKHGGEKELTAIWGKASVAGAYPPALRQKIFGLLGEAALSRKVTPKAKPAEMLALLKETKATESLHVEAIRLASAWKVIDASAQLQLIATNPKASHAVRFAAMDALSRIGIASAQKILHELAGPPHPLPIRFHAAVALIPLDLLDAARVAAAAIAASKDGVDLGPVVEGFLVSKNGPKELASAMEKEKISADAAKGVLKAMYLAGHNDPALSPVINKLAGLGAVPKLPSPMEISQLMTAAKEKGDPTRGELVFRRADLGCMKCHAVNKAGGHIGPDLGGVGGSSPMEYIVQSILDPNASIKEEYLTKMIFTNAGKIYQGIEVERGKNQLVLKDATGKHHKIPLSDIDQEAKGKSLMPEGVTQILTKNELLDLIAFVSELGKPGPFAPLKTPTIQRWKWLQNVPAALLDNVPNRDELRDKILNAVPENWQPVYTMVNGKLPLNELRKPGTAKVLYLQGEFNILQPGTVQIQLDSTEWKTWWIDEEPATLKGNSIVNFFAPGRHTITVRVVVDSKAKLPTLSVNLIRPADSKANFEVVHAE